MNSNKKILNIMYFFLLLQPIIDLITSFMTKFSNTFFTLGMLIRGLLFVVSIFYIFFITKSKYKKKSIVYFIILFLFMIGYFITKQSLFDNLSFLLTEVTYVFKFFYAIVILLFLFNFFDEFKPNNRKVFKLLQIELFLYCFFIVLANLTNTAFATYAYGMGNSGWFYSGNEISTIICLLFPLIYLFINKTTSYKVLFYVIPIILGIEIIGTKVSMLGLLLPTIIFFFYYLIRFKDGKKKQLIITSIILALIIVSSPNLPVLQNIRENISMFNSQNHDKDDDYADDIFSKIIYSDRDYYNKQIKKIYDKSDFTNKLFGIGFTNRKEINNDKISKLIEMDFHDIFYRYGIIGFIIYCLPFILIIISILKLCLKKKFILNMKQLILGYISGIGLMVAFVAGHTLTAPAVSFYIAIALVLLIYYLKNDYYRININNNKITILALHLGTGGVEKYISDLCKMLENDYEIEIISTYKVKDNLAFDFSDKISIKYLTNTYPHKQEFISSLKNKKIFDSIKYAFGLIKLFFEKYLLNILCIEDIDSKYIISTRIFHNNIVRRNKNRDIIAIATEHNYHNNNNKYIQKVIKSVNNFDYLVCVSEELRDFYKNKLENTKVLFIPNTIDNIPKYKKKKINNFLISVGRMSQEKGFIDLLYVMKEITKNNNKVKLILVGDGNQKNEIVQKIKELKLEKNIILTGLLTSEEVYYYLKKSSVYVMSSYTESFGIVLLEAMANGLPCVAFDSASGAKFLLKHKKGILIKDRSIKKMAAEILNLLEDNNRYYDYSESGYKYCQKYSLETVKKMWLKLLSRKVS